MDPAPLFEPILAAFSTPKETAGYPGMCHYSVTIWEALHHHDTIICKVPLLSKHSNTFHDLSSVLFSTLWANPHCKIQAWWYHGKSMSLTACKTELLTATGDHLSWMSETTHVWNQDKLGNSLNWMQSEKLKDSSGTQSVADFKNFWQKQSLKKYKLKNPHQKSKWGFRKHPNKTHNVLSLPEMQQQASNSKGSRKSCPRILN